MERGERTGKGEGSASPSSSFSICQWGGQGNGEAAPVADAREESRFVLDLRQDLLVSGMRV